MLSRAFLYLVGYIKIKIDSGSAGRLKEALFNAKLPVIFIRGNRRGRVKSSKIIIKRTDAPYFYEIADSVGVEYTVLCKRGLPFIYKRFRYRWGLLLGLLLLAATLYISDDFVWEMRVTGNENVDAEEIISQLDTLGFRRGTYYKNIDFDVLHNRFLRDSDDIAWIAVNMRGSVANIEVREYMPGDDEQSDKNPANIIAGCGGRITQVSAFAGRPSVKIGDIVTPGQLLISGVMEYERADTRYLRAKGEVYAEVEREITVNIPTTRTVLRDDGEKIKEYGIKIFSKEIFFDVRGRIDSTFYDTITAYDDIILFNTVTLPMKLITREHTRKIECVERLTEAEAAAEAYKEYKMQFIEACSDVILLSYDMTCGMTQDGGAYEINCVIRCIDNIAKTLEFEITQ